MLIGDIEDYRHTLDRVGQQGRHLVQGNVKTPKFAQQVQSQLTNLEESYLNLQTTAEQIRVSNSGRIRTLISISHCSDLAARHLTSE